MFYSKELLSVKGPLGNIWVAACGFKKLRKEQVAGTNISSTVDIIIPDVQLSYRLLAHLLLGVVRIFSKKVDYLFNDCNEILIRLGRSFLCSQWNTPKRATGGCGRTKGPTHGKSGNLALREEHPCVEAIRRALPDDITLTLPKSFELDSFDLEVTEEEENTNIHEQLIQVEAETYQLTFLERHDDHMVIGSGHFSGCFTPVEDVIPPGLWEVDFEVRELQGKSISIVKQKLQDDQAPEECWKHSRVRRSLNLSFSQELEEQADQQYLPQAHLTDLCPASPEGYSEVGNPVSQHEKPCVALPEAASPEFQVTTPAIKERRRIVGKRKSLFDDIVVLSNDTMRQWIHDASGLTCKRRKAPHTLLDAWKAQKLSNTESRLMEPLIPCTPPDFKTIFLERSFSPSAQETLATSSQYISDVGKGEVLAESEQRDEVLLSASPSQKVEDKPEEPLTIERTESEMTVIDRESFSAAEESNTDDEDGWSSRTRSLAKYFCHRFEQEGSRVLSLIKVLEGKRRTKCAMFFYETIVLASRGYVIVGQELPYGDITVSAAPTMRPMLENVPGRFKAAAARTMVVTGS